MIGRALLLATLGLAVFAGFASPPPLRAGAPDERDENAGGPPETDVSFELTPQKHWARRGEAVEVSLGISCQGVPVDLELLGFSVEFDASRLLFLEAVLHPSFQLGSGSEFEWFHDAEEGWVQGVLEVGGEDEGPGIPCGAGRPIVTLRFEVKADAPEGDAELIFTRPETADYEGQLSDGENVVYNSVRVRGHGSPTPSAPRFENAREARVLEEPQRVSILGDIGLFSRGDANGDSVVDISDPVFLLQHLYLGGPAPILEQAADANQDGRLDLGDVITVLYELFLPPLGES